MAELPLAQGIDRFKQNEDRMDRFTNGSDTQTFTTSGGQVVPTIRKFLKDKDTEINTASDGILALAVSAKNAAIDAADASADARDESVAARSDSISARNQSQAWAEGTAPGGAGTRSAKEWSEVAQDAVEGVRPSFYSVAAIASAVIPASVKTINTEFFAPNVLAPKTMVGRAQYRRVSLDALTGFPAACYFRSSDRFMPDETTDATKGGYWLLDEKRPNVHMTGAVGDGTTDDTAAINAALAYITLKGGGEVDMFPTGAAYRTTTSIIIGNGAALVASATSTFPGTTAPKADWVKYGTWINPTHATQSGVILQGHGSALRGLSFWHDQPTPTGGTYTPNNYGWAIEVRASHTTVEDIILANATNGIIYNYTSTSGGGTGVSLRNILAGCIRTCLNTTCVNDTMHIENFHARPIWQTGFIQTVYFLLTTAWDCGYTDNCIVNGFEAVFLNIGIYFRNQLCLENTHSMYNAQISGLQLSLCQTAMKVENANAVVTGQINEMVVQQGDMFGFTWSNECFTLNSDYVDLMIGLLRINDAGGRIGTLGHGVGGRLTINQFDVRKYSSIAAGQVGWAVDANFKLSITSETFRKPSNAGARFSGVGSEQVVTGAYAVVKEPFGRFSEFDVTAGSTGWTDLGTDSLFRPGMAGVHQCRIIGDFNVLTAQPGTTAQLRFSSMPNAISTTLSTASTGWKNFDTGWIDIDQANLDSLVAFGRPQINLGANVRVQNGAFALLVR